MNDPKNQVWLGQLHNHGYRITNPMKVIVDILAKSDHLLNPSEVFLQAKIINPKIGLVTVYRTIEKMEQSGLIDRVHMPDGCQSFFRSSDGHQHLLICTECGKAEYFEGENLSPFFQKIGEQFGYQVTDHWLQLFGICLECSNKKSISPGK
ncbi:MAG: Fur family transcriptional regulator [Anaerolineaceae bacterium]|nr:Fur family transcriptional regulator [Anaerolineaceae bacterium]